VKLRQQARGFTLLEVLVAIMVLALGMVAVISSSTQSLNSLGYMKSKTLAHWVAMNKITELQLEPNWPSAGTKSGDYEMSGIDWRWEAKVSDTEDNDVRRVDVNVYVDRESKESLALVIGYLGRPL